MDSKIIIVRMKSTLTDAIGYLEQSLNTQIERFYSVNEEDTPVVSANNGLQCMVAFVVFEPDDIHKQDHILKLYVGNGHMLMRPKKPKIYQMKCLKRHSLKAIGKLEQYTTGRVYPWQ